MNKRMLAGGVMGMALVMAAGCSGKKDATKDNFKKAIASYYNAHPECVWSSPVKFPVEADPNKGDQTAGYDALTDAGLLTRTSAQKKVFIFGSKQVNDYDLSDKGRSVWSPDSSQPGYGNFCYGHREVTGVDNFVANGEKHGESVANADYHYTVSGISSWADSTEMKTAFPTIQAQESGPKVDKATLVLTDDGWQVSHD
ncbi:MAG TPA: hypothetical protein VGD62_12380 [Acidobacteriaceae bacterium]